MPMRPAEIVDGSQFAAARDDFDASDGGWANVRHQITLLCDCAIETIPFAYAMKPIKAVSCLRHWPMAARQPSPGSSGCRPQSRFR
jgi:hypothetical protein